MSDLFKKKEHNLTEEDFKKIKYTNFHNHSTYSLLDGIGSVEEHIIETHNKGHKGCCITDHGVMSSSLELYYKSRDKGLLELMNYEGSKYPVVMGCELYITNDALYKDKNSKYHHITVLAKNEQGYKNLSYLTSVGSKTDHFYTRPRVSLKELFDNKEGLIITTGCFISFISQAIFLKKGHLKNYFYKIFEGKSEFSKEEEEAFGNFKEDENFEKYLKYIENEDFKKILINNQENIFDNEIFLELLKFKEGRTAKEKDFSERLIRDLFLIFGENTADELVLMFKREFPNDLYVEFHPTNICMKWDRNLRKHIDQGWNPLEEVNRELLRISLKHELKVIICQDSHMPKKEHYDAQNIMIWNSTSGKKGWHFSEAYYIMSIEDMYKKITSIYPWISDEQFVEWANNSQEILDKCNDMELNFSPSLPELDYEDHYVNKVPNIIRRDVMLDLQEYGLWNEDIKEYMKENNKMPLMREFFKEDFEEGILKLTEKMTKFKTLLSDDFIKKEERYKKSIKLLNEKIKENKLVLKNNISRISVNEDIINSDASEEKEIKLAKKENTSLKRKNTTIDRNIIKFNQKLEDEKTLLKEVEESNYVKFDYKIDLESYFELLRIDEDITKIKELNLKDFIESFMPIDQIESNPKFVRFLKGIGSFSEEQNNYLKVYIKYENEDLIDYKEMEDRRVENIYLEEVLVKMEEFYKDKEEDFYKILYKSKSDIQLRTCLKVIMRNKKIIPKIIKKNDLENYIQNGINKKIEKLNKEYERTKDENLKSEIEKAKKIKSSKDLEKDYVQFLIDDKKFYKLSEEEMELLGDRRSRERLAFEIETIQYNGVLKLISYFMLIEDVTNFHFENNYLRGLGRGSGAGSLLAYGLNITDCPPLENGLFFERFLTRERICEVFFDIEEDGLSFEDFLKEKEGNA